MNMLGAGRVWPAPRRCSAGQHLPLASAATSGRIKQVEQGWPPPGVSAREAEVLEGVAEHLTNAEIGGRLFISIRTVESHVSSLLRKLGARDRRALAGIAASLGPAARTATWPSPLTSFVGRAAERSVLA